MTTPRRWGKAGVRLRADEVRARTLAIIAAKPSTEAIERRLDVAYELWRAGEFRPYRATDALDMLGLEGPDVDIACGGREPDVDLWEEGKRYPTWEQLLLLANLVGLPPLALVSGRPPVRWDQTSMRFHVKRGHAPPTHPIERCREDFVDLVVRHTPETRPR